MSLIKRFWLLGLVAKVVMTLIVLSIFGAGYYMFAIAG